LKCADFSVHLATVLFGEIHAQTVVDHFFGISGNRIDNQCSRIRAAQKGFNLHRHL
jgi:hypothetical protein